MKILLVDDDRDSRICVRDFLQDLGHTIVECDNGIEALAVFANDDFPMVLSDIKMPKMSGLELLHEITRRSPRADTDVVLFTGHGDMESAIEALRSGAYDYLIKPINVEELAVITEHIAEHQALLRENKNLSENFENELLAATKETHQEITRLKKIVSQSVGLDGIGFFSEEMNELVRQAEKYHTDRSIPVLIEGETGTGKEVIAKIIHYGNIRDDCPFVDVNCAALTPTLFESELFGYEGGAFTGGLTKGHKGKFDLAQGGTLFLDEVAEIPLEVQGKLLRVLQEKEFYRVGGLKKIKTSVRLICATNVDLQQKVSEGSFRKDLYYRLKVGHIVLPPLRQRQSDILPLAELFLKEFAQRKGKQFQNISLVAGRILLNYHWPGNVRELRNLMEWVLFMYDAQDLQPFHLKQIDPKQSELLFIGQPSLARDKLQEEKNYMINPNQFDLPKEGLKLEDYVQKIVNRALEMNHGNKTETARYLGISRRSLYTRLEKP